MERKTKTFEIEGKEITLETGKIARQANGSVLLHCGDTTILTTACASKKSLEDVDFLPLRVDYVEKFSSVVEVVRLIWLTSFKADSIGLVMSLSTFSTLPTKYGA